MKEFIFKRNFFWLKILLDGILLTSSFFFVYYLKRGGFYKGEFLSLDEIFSSFFPYFISLWFFTSIFFRKFKNGKERSFLNSLKQYIVFVLVFIGLLTIILYIKNWFFLSRLIVFGSIGLYFIVEIMLYLFGYIIYISRKNQKENYFSPIFFFIIELFFLFGSFLIVHYLKAENIRISNVYLIFFIGVVFLWMIISFFIHQFIIEKKTSFLKTLFPFLISKLIIIGLVSFIILFLKLEFFSRIIVFGTLLLFSFLEFVFITLYFVYSKTPATDEVRHNFFNVGMIKEESYDLEIALNKKKSESSFIYKYDMNTDRFVNNLKMIYLKEHEELFSFINSIINLNRCNIENTKVMYSSNPYNIEILKNKSLEFFLNLREINDFRRINKVFIEVNRRLKVGGFFIGKFFSLAQSKKKYFDKYPYAFARLLYPICFLFKRVFPKLPVLQKLYFTLSKGKKRDLSRSEALGRLYYCGFEIIDLKTIDNATWYIAKKIKDPSTDKNPSYGPLIKMVRYGKGGKLLYIYKIRTMHPYSEYLQAFVTKNIGYGNKDKVKNDFRVTRWGRFFRRYWLDEIPQLYNLLKGDLKIIGVRPVSKTFLSTYPEDLKKMRFKLKPGCIPPYVAYKMQSREQYIESERIYIYQKEKHPVWTDIKVFFLAIYNIITNKIRSE